MVKYMSIEELRDDSNVDFVELCKNMSPVDFMITKLIFCIFDF